MFYFNNYSRIECPSIYFLASLYIIPFIFGICPSNAENLLLKEHLGTLIYSLPSIWTGWLFRQTWSLETAQNHIVLNQASFGAYSCTEEPLVSSKFLWAYFVNFVSCLLTISTQNFIEFGDCCRVLKSRDIDLDVVHLR